MTTSFRAKIREKIADEALQAALDANAERRVQGRINAFASLPDWQERRQRAHAVRAEVITHLGEYLDKFILKVTENGITVHRAKDAAEAIGIFLDILDNSPRSGEEREGIQKNQISAHQHASASRLIAKSKSMVTEEIGLNHALEDAGHRVVETDLGEYIVQLRGERPSHIITPAVHLRRHEVGQLFAEKLGIPYTEDIPTLTNTARKVLRGVFLSADVGVSGVNFGVAETGTLTIVTNEGNGRMVTTLPPLHIAVMGMERLVPTLDDLALMLSLLPRSATGQKISVYTQLIQRPEAGQQKHLILVDNGRSSLCNSPLEEALYCIRCGACLNACPVFREIGGHAYLGTNGNIAPYPGPIGSVVSPGLLGRDYFQLAQASTLCGACKDACPVDIDLPKLLTRVRAGKSADQGNALPEPVKIGLRTYTRFATRPGLFALSQRLAGLGARFVSPISAWMKFPAFTGWGYSKDFPRPAVKPFRDRWQEIQHRNTFPHGDDKHAEIQGAISEKENLTTKDGPKVNLVGRFTEELLALGGHVIICKEADLPNKVITLLREKNIDRVQTWDQIPGLDEGNLSEAGIQFQHEADESDESIKAGITGALAGIAETGTLVIPGGKGRPLTASLLPEIHIVVLRASDIEESLEKVMELRKVETYPSGVLVSGPSRTADIEMTLTIGVHGPGELYVFVVT
ncbi:MAG: LUD domain-containing protein [Anaerolineales bacterium]|nr:LUD domain-containing protein [Anaerolineales bacterium]